MKKVILIVLLSCSIFLSGCFSLHAGRISQSGQYIPEAQEQEKQGSLLAGILGISMGIWGLKQDTTYGNWSGAIFLISGTINILSIEF